MAEEEMTPQELARFRQSHLKTQVPWDDKSQYVICKSSEIDSAIQVAYQVGLLDQEFERMMDS